MMMLLLHIYFWLGVYLAYFSRRLSMGGSEATGIAPKGPWTSRSEGHYERRHCVPERGTTYKIRTLF